MVPLLPLSVVVDVLLPCVVVISGAGLNRGAVVTTAEPLGVDDAVVATPPEVAVGVVVAADEDVSSTEVDEADVVDVDEAMLVADGISVDVVAAAVVATVDVVPRDVAIVDVDAPLVDEADEEEVVIDPVDAEGVVVDTAVVAAAVVVATAVAVVPRGIVKPAGMG